MYKLVSRRLNKARNHDNLTIREMGIDDEKTGINVIMQTVSREGKYNLKIKGQVDFYDLMADKLVSFNVLSRKFK